MAIVVRDTRAIDGVQFRIGWLSVANGRDALVRLQRTFGPALGELVEGGLKGGTARAFASLADRLALADLNWFCERFGECTEATFQDAEGQECVLTLSGVNQDKVFAGRYKLMFAWLEFCLESNFRDFFEAMRAQLQDALAASRTTPTPSQ